jgi:shikimate dehydrogenase
MKVYGLLGKTLKHSFSKGYFTEKFSALSINDCVYENFELPDITALPQLLKNNPDILGLNVTIPYKEDVIPFLDEQNEIVSEIKACNCIKINNGKLTGYNTDVIGFKQSLESCLEPHHGKALILGTGGAAKAVQYALDLLGISYLNVSRSKRADTITYDEVSRDLLNEYYLIVNTSPTGMYPNMDEAPILPYEHLSDKHLLFDLIYNPEKTLFLQKGAERGAKICNGAEMLILQAEESWRIWNEKSIR